MTSCIISFTRVHYRMSWFTFGYSIIFVLYFFHCYCQYEEKFIFKSEYLYTWSIINSLQQNGIGVTCTSLLLRKFITKGNQIHNQLPLKIVTSTTYSSCTTFTSQTHSLYPEALSRLETALNLLFPLQQLMLSTIT